MWRHAIAIEQCARKFFDSPSGEVEARQVDSKSLFCVADEVDGFIAEPGQHLVEQPLALREHHALPDEADDGEREHDREVVDALVDAGAADVLVEQVGEEHAERRRQTNRNTSSMKLLKSAGNSLLSKTVKICQ